HRHKQSTSFQRAGTPELERDPVLYFVEESL
uniref:Uncharacterized protein n=1 Tax=Amphimedon queenslandica TaxID=400682 RepID=A0A1X7UFV9_AMPQE